MKSILFLGFCIAIVLHPACEKTEKTGGAKPFETELQKPISAAAQLHVIEEWQIFLKESGTALLEAEEKLQRLEIKLSQKNNKEKVEMRRLYNAAHRRHEKLRDKLLSHGILFKKNIVHYRVKDVVKNQSFCTEFTAELTDLHGQLDQALLTNP